MDHVALARAAHGAELVDGRLIEPDEIVAVGRALRLIYDGAKRERGGDGVEGGRGEAMRIMGLRRTVAGLLGPSFIF